MILVSRLHLVIKSGVLKRFDSRMGLLWGKGVGSEELELFSPIQFVNSGKRFTIFEPSLL